MVPPQSVALPVVLIFTVSIELALPDEIHPLANRARSEAATVKYKIWSANLAVSAAAARKVTAVLACVVLGVPDIRLPAMVTLAGSEPACTEKLIDLPAALVAAKLVESACPSVQAKLAPAAGLDQVTTSTL